MTRSNEKRAPWDESHGALGWRLEVGGGRLEVGGWKVLRPPSSYFRRVIWSQSAAPPPPMRAPMPAPFLPPTAAPMPAPAPAEAPMITALFFTDRFGCVTRSVR